MIQKPFKILHILRCADGGVPVVVDRVCHGLDRNRFEPVVFFDSGGQSQIKKKILESDIKTIEIGSLSKRHPTGLNGTNNSINIAGLIENKIGKISASAYLALRSAYKFLRQDALKAKSLAHIIRENGIDLVHTHTLFENCKPEIIAAGISGIPCILHSHGYSNTNYFDRLFSRFVDKFIHISSDVAEHQISAGVSRQKSVVIHNSVDLSEFEERYDRDEIRQEFGIHPDDVVIGIFGRICWWKGQDVFVRAMAEVAEKYQNIKGVIVGAIEKDFNAARNENYLENLKELIANVGLEKNIVFTGPRADVPRVLSAMNIVVHASTTPEPFGLVVIEAMAAGKPVIATAAGGILEILENGVNSLLVPCEDPGAIARSIKILIENREMAENLGKAALERVSKKFTVQSQATAIQNVYNELLLNN